MKGVIPEQLPSYLDEYMWREKNAGLSKFKKAAWNVILAHIAEQYPLTCNV